MSQAPAGWYPQPDGTERYWSGAGWTDVVRPAAYAVTPGAPIPAPTGYPSAYVQDAGSARPPAMLPAVMPAPLVYGVPVARKSPGGALVASFVLPGLGQLINGEGTKAALFLILSVIFGVLSMALIGLPFLFILWVWGCVDAYTSASRWNAQHGLY